MRAGGLDAGGGLVAGGGWTRVGASRVEVWSILFAGGRRSTKLPLGRRSGAAARRPRPATAARVGGLDAGGGAGRGWGPRRGWGLDAGGGLEGRSLVDLVCWWEKIDQTSARPTVWGGGPPTAARRPRPGWGASTRVGASRVEVWSILFAGGRRSTKPPLGRRSGTAPRRPRRADGGAPSVTAPRSGAGTSPRARERGTAVRPPRARERGTAVRPPRPRNRPRYAGSGPGSGPCSASKSRLTAPKISRERSSSSRVKVAITLVRSSASPRGTAG